MRRRFIRFSTWWAAPLACMGLSCASPPTDRQPPASPSARVREVVGDASIDLLAHADRVEPIRIKADHQPTQNPGEERIEGFLVIGRGVMQGRAYAARLASVVLSDKSYDWQYPKGCLPLPGVILRAYRGDAFADVFLCFECDELRVIAHNGSDVSKGFWNDDPARPTLVKLAKKAFPNDNAIQDLKE